MGHIPKHVKAYSEITHVADSKNKTFGHMLRRTSGAHVDGKLQFLDETSASASGTFAPAKRNFDSSVYGIDDSTSIA